MSFDWHQRTQELEERVRVLVSANRELEKRVEELTPRVFFVATLQVGQPLYWAEA